MIISNIADTRISSYSADKNHKSLINTFRQVSAEILLELTVYPKRPWISSHTLDFVGKRNRLRKAGNWAAEKELTKIIKRSVRHNKERWLNERLEQGSWMDVRNLKKKPQHQQSRLKNLNGDLVDSSYRAEIITSHLEKIQ